MLRYASAIAGSAGTARESARRRRAHASKRAPTRASRMYVRLACMAGALRRDHACRDTRMNRTVRSHVS